MSTYANYRRSAIQAVLDSFGHKFLTRSEIEQVVDLLDEFVASFSSPDDFEPDRDEDSPTTVFEFEGTTETIYHNFVVKDGKVLYRRTIPRCSFIEFPPSLKKLIQPVGYCQNYNARCLEDGTLLVYRGEKGRPVKYAPATKSKPNLTQLNERQFSNYLFKSELEGTPLLLILTAANLKKMLLPAEMRKELFVKGDNKLKEKVLTNLPVLLTRFERVYFISTLKNRYRNYPSLPLDNCKGTDEEKLSMWLDFWKGKIPQAELKHVCYRILMSCASSKKLLLTGNEHEVRLLTTPLHPMAFELDQNAAGFDLNALEEADQEFVCTVLKALTPSRSPATPLKISFFWLCKVIKSSQPAETLRKIGLLIERYGNFGVVITTTECPARILIQSCGFPAKVMNPNPGTLGTRELIQLYSAYKVLAQAPPTSHATQMIHQILGEFENYQLAENSRKFKVESVRPAVQPVETMADSNSLTCPNPYSNVEELKLKLIEMLVTKRTKRSVVQLLKKIRNLNPRLMRPMMGYYFVLLKVFEPCTVEVRKTIKELYQRTTNPSFFNGLKPSVSHAGVPCKACKVCKGCNACKACKCYEREITKPTDDVVPTPIPKQRDFPVISDKVIKDCEINPRIAIYLRELLSAEPEENPETPRKQNIVHSSEEVAREFLEVLNDGMSRFDYLKMQADREKSRQHMKKNAENAKDKAIVDSLKLPNKCSPVKVRDRDQVVLNPYLTREFGMELRELNRHKRSLNCDWEHTSARHGNVTRLVHSKIPTPTFPFKKRINTYCLPEKSLVRLRRLALCPRPLAGGPDMTKARKAGLFNLTPQERKRMAPPPEPPHLLTKSRKAGLLNRTPQQMKRMEPLPPPVLTRVHRRSPVKEIVDKVASPTVAVGLSRMLGAAFNEFVDTCSDESILSEAEVAITKTSNHMLHRIQEKRSSIS